MLQRWARHCGRFLVLTDKACASGEGAPRDVLHAHFDARKGLEVGHKSSGLPLRGKRRALTDLQSVLDAVAHVQRRVEECPRNNRLPIDLLAIAAPVAAIMISSIALALLVLSPASPAAPVAAGCSFFRSCAASSKVSKTLRAQNSTVVESLPSGLLKRPAATAVLTLSTKSTVTWRQRFSRHRACGCSSRESLERHTRAEDPRLLQGQ